MSKKIVVCADGTGNKFCNNNTNVVRLYSALDLSNPDRQIAYYHGGLGTIGAPGALSQWAQRWSKIKGLAFGYGLTHDIADCYAFLMETWEPGDEIYLFGFSRGAYVVRALAATLHMFGLIRPKDDNLIGYAVSMLKEKPDKDSFQIAADFKKTFSRECPTHFVGVWDTVSSVGWIYDPLHIPYTFRNPEIAIGRHAISIDERRTFFRPNRWGDPLPGQDLKQVYFAGVHSDVGGGYPELESGLAKIAFEWMCCEAAQAGLVLVDAEVQRLLGYTGTLTKPDAGGQMHNSLSDAWILLEPLPHRYYDDTCQPPRPKWRIPLGRRRTIKPTAVIHASVNDRIALGKDYPPVNLPAGLAVEPWVRWKQCPCAAAAASGS